MIPRAAKLLTGFFIVAALLLVAALIFVLNQPPPAPPSLPQPNGWDDFVRAGRMVPDNSSDFSTMSEADLRALSLKNSEVLKLARTGLTHACQVPLDLSSPNSTYYTNLVFIKRLAQAMTAEGRLAELDNRPADASEAYLNVIRMGFAISQGGLLIDSLVGIAVEAIGTTGMERLAPKLDSQQCRAAARVLEFREAEREPVAAVLSRERTWFRRAYGLKGQISRLVMFNSARQTEQKWAAKQTTHQTRLRRLLVELAARAYELEKGERPKRLAELFPEYLKTIPRDPITGTNMAYP